MKIVLIATLFTLSLSTMANSYLEFEAKQRSLVHIVKKGETLGQILNNYQIHNIYGNKIKNKHLNPVHLTMWKNGLSDSDLNKLEPGQKLYLPILNRREIASYMSDIVEEDEITDKEIKKFIIEYARNYED